LISSFGFAQTGFPPEMAGKYQGEWQSKGTSGFYYRKFTIKIKPDGTGTYCWGALPQSTTTTEAGCSPITSVTIKNKELEIKWKSKDPTTRIFWNVEKHTAIWEGHASYRGMESKVERITESTRQGPK